MAEMGYRAVSGSLGFAVLAGEFVTEPETWPVFAAWLATQMPAGAIPLTREMAKYLGNQVSQALEISDAMAALAGEPSD